MAHAPAPRPVAWGECAGEFCVAGTPIRKWYGPLASRLGINHVDVTYDRTVSYVGLMGDPGRDAEVYAEVADYWKLIKRNTGSLAYGTRTPCRGADTEQIRECLRAAGAYVPATYNCQGSVQFVTGRCCLDGFDTMVSAFFPTW